MVVQLLLFGLTPTFKTKAVGKHSIMVLGVTQMRSNGEGAVQTRSLFNIVGIRLDAILGHDGRGFYGRRLYRRGFGWWREEGRLSGQVVSWTAVQEGAQIGNEERVLDVSKSCKRSHLRICDDLAL